MAAFDKLEKPLGNNTELQEFLSTYFGEAGSELVDVPADQLETDPIFLDDIEDSVIKQFVEKVIDIWPDLTRKYVGADACDGCVDSYIPINRTCTCYSHILSVVWSCPRVLSPRRLQQ